MVTDFGFLSPKPSEQPRNPGVFAGPTASEAPCCLDIADVAGASLATGGRAPKP